MPIRKIIHVGMDAFYAFIEQRDHPELSGRPLAVPEHGPWLPRPVTKHVNSVFILRCRQ